MTARSRRPLPCAPLLCWLLAVAPLQAPSAQSTWHVSAEACPGPGSGDEDDPFCRIRDALEAARPGDTILVGPGVYPGQLELVSGVDVIGAGAGRSLLTGAGEDVNVVQMVSLTDVRLARFSITGATLGGGGSVGAGVFVNLPSASLVIEDCEIFGNASGITVWNAFGLQGPDILNNDIHDNLFYGIDCPGAGFVIGNRIHGNGAGVYQGPENVRPRFYNNTIWGNLGDGVFYENDARSVFRDNIIAANGGFGIREFFGGGFLIATPTLTRNIFHANALGNFRKSPPGTTLNTTAELNSLATALDNQAVDPLLCRPPGSFRLCIHSPAVGAGLLGVDIGALGTGCGGFAPAPAPGGTESAVRPAWCPSSGPQPPAPGPARR